MEHLRGHNQKKPRGEKIKSKFQVTMTMDHMCTRNITCAQEAYHVCTLYVSRAHMTNDVTLLQAAAARDAQDGDRGGLFTVCQNSKTHQRQKLPVNQWR